MIRTTFLLWKLLRRLHLATPGTELRAVSINIIVEPDSSFERRAQIARSLGEPVPIREHMHEVSYWPIVGEPCYTQRGATLAEAIRKALDAPFPAGIA